jgi:hypothetical protein
MRDLNFEVSFVNISVQKLLAKIEAELKQAKNSQKEENLREKIYSIKILCELILDEQHEKSEESWSTAAIQKPAPGQQIYQPQVVQQPAVMPQPKKLEIDDGANGDSLFDF